MVKIDKKTLVVPSCSGVLDAFNTRLSRYYRHESMCHIKDSCDTLLALALFSFLYYIREPDPKTCSCSYTFKISEFKKYISFVGGGKSKDIKQELLKLAEVGYVWQYVPEDGLLEISFNASGTVATVSSAYYNHIYNHMAEQKGSSYSSMICTSILKERNVGAAELTIELVKLIERRGQIQEGQTTEISIPTLVERCSSLYDKVQGKEVKEQNRIVKTSLFKALELLRVHTQVYACFEELEVNLPEKINLRKESKLNFKYNRRIF